MNQASNKHLIAPLDELLVKVDKDFIINLTSENGIEKTAKRNCKVIKQSFDYNLPENFRKLNQLNLEEYPNLFIFILEIKNFTTFENDNFKILTNILLNFDATRPIILQIISKDESITKYFIKEAQSNTFDLIDLNQKQCDEFQNFPEFLYNFVNQNFQNFEDEIIEKLPESNICSITVKFLRSLNLSQIFFNKLVLKCSAYGSKSTFLAALDVPFTSDGRMLSYKSQELLYTIFGENLDQFDEEVDNEEDQLSEASSSESVKSSASSENFLNTSVLYTAVQNINKEIIDFLISDCTHLIQQLTPEHQVRISTAAFESEQYNVLCDLVELSDYPFPENFNIHSVVDERLKAIAVERANFAYSIKNVKTQNYTEIDKFINKNLSLRLVYNPENKTALKQVFESKKYKLYFYLKSLGFKTSKFENHAEDLDQNELEQANIAAQKQRTINTQNALSDQNISVLLLSTRSFIHNRKITRDQEFEYRMKIKKWYQDILKIDFGSELLRVASSCEKLKIIFDFDSISVDNMSFEGQNTFGSLYSNKKWIFVGSKISDEKREQKIKGVLAHELCHYVMKLVYENQESPYYKHRVDLAAIFEAIVEKIDKWSSENFDHPDDECNGIISSVFRCYDKINFHPELIVRVVQILAEFDFDNDKSGHLKALYLNLFEFFRIHVLPDLLSFNLKVRERMRKLNRTIELLQTITTLKIELSSPKDIKTLIDNKFAIIHSNIPKLLLVDIYNHLLKKQGDLFDAQNLFIDSKMLRNEEIFKDTKQIVKGHKTVCIFIFCLVEPCNHLEILLRIKSLNSIFIISNEDNFNQLINLSAKNELTFKTMTMKYDMQDLSIESQKSLLQMKINFQGNSNFSLFDILKAENENLDANQDAEQEENSQKTNDTEEENILKDFLEIVNDELLRNLIDKKQIVINYDMNCEIDANFDFLYVKRFLIKNTDKKQIESQNKKQIDEDIETELNEIDQNPQYENSEDDSSSLSYNSSEMTNEESYDKIDVKNSKISLDKLYYDSKNQKYILISDIAGTGKSWIMKKLTRILHEQIPARWVTYVDLKQFIKVFVPQNNQLDFLSFFTEKILKSNFNCERKLFSKLYKKGKVSILFDGFDEIAPDCADFVLNLIKKFEANGSNKMFIATRDYFEIDLKKNLELDTVYNLGEFLEKDGINFITRSWLLNDFRAENNSNNLVDFESFVEKSPKYKNYNKAANEIVKKISVQKLRSIGLPQLFKMIVDSFKKFDKNAVIDFKEYILYEKFGKDLYERWLQKGDIRRTANTNSLKWKLNFWTLHQYVAIKTLFPKYSNKDLEKGLLEWIDEEIVACGLITKRNGKLIFLHETFREFFAADFIASKLGNSEVDEGILEIFTEILTINKFGIVRMFLNDASIENLLDFIKKIFLNLDREEIEKIVDKNAIYYACETINSEMIIKFQKFLSEFYSNDEFKKILKSEHHSSKTMLHNKIYNLRNIQTFNNLWTIYRTSFNDHEFLEVLAMKDNYNRDILHIAGRRSADKVFVTVLEELEKIPLRDEIRNILRSLGDVKQNLLQSASYDLQNLETHKLIWKIYPKYFDKAEMKEFINYINGHDNNLLYDILHNKSENAEFIWNQMKMYMTREEQVKCLTTKRCHGQNIIKRCDHNNNPSEIRKWVESILKEYGLEIPKYTLPSIEGYISKLQSRNKRFVWKLKPSFFMKKL